MKRYLSSLLLLVAVVLACEPTCAADNRQVIREESRLLTQDYATFRKSQLSDVTYDLSVQVSEDSDIFSGTVSIGFTLTQDNHSPVTIDFDEGEILSLTINGAPGDYDYARWYITIPAEELSSGVNQIVIGYRRPYTTDGDGLHKFTDPENGEIYLYTNFEPYNANRFFPHFDQPNLKARFTLEATVPANWQVISNMGAVTSTRAQGSGTAHWIFPTTPPISSYLYSFHAGPYTVWEDRTTNLPLRLFARSSLARYVDPDEWFTPAKQFMAFYQDYFDVPYPLDKYDQIVVPDFNPGAMENIGAVTYNEAYVSRGEKSISQRARHAYVIAHEMAHMWFGDLVTMNWWNDVWLNESFATYMGYLALDQASEYGNAWDIFYSRGKSNAYRSDDLVTTHPVALEAATTADAFNNFDTITYQKGSAILKQLPFFIGEDNFRRGVSNYLMEHSYGNATLDDFFDALSDSSGLDLDPWKREWLQTSGANVLQAEFSCSDGRLTGLRLIQHEPETATADKVLRTQRTLIGLYRYTDNEMVMGRSLPVTYSGRVTEVPEAAGLPCPDLVFPNEDDHAYLEIDLDEVSRDTLREHINEFDSSTTRLMLWHSLWAGVLDTRLPLDEFVDFAFSNIGSETNDDVIRQVSGNLVTAFSYYTRIGGHDDARRALQDFALERLIAADPGSESQKIWYANFVNRAHTPEALGFLGELLEGTSSVPGLDIDQDKRWDIVFALNRFQYGDYDDLLAREAARDASDQGVNSALATRAARPDSSIKKEFLDIITGDPDRYKLATMRAIMFSLFPPEQNRFADEFADTILSAYPEMNRTGDERYMDAYIELLPATCSEASLERLQRVSDSFRNYRPVFGKRFLQIQQEDQRCVDIGALVD